ncbi:potassium transporter TrkG [Mycoplasmopsis cynos]|uniref:potassium transporter TrkG n=1 Tax=Mycoplasmopsis cynos TaxID=171284 RepID=UPI002AFDF54F|nr:potassium transporter TrkG [Mycoplasmopsis cynos]WQQ12904.1 potassium transporter TrkG [Mycoplasmopsis cynos]WQQ13793.1 potassium transporter TrkG [Mycoplasmopsis cynos]WQQ17386.1 potassium transporter TrkG [Mycoplasmopsis cynos]WQQ19094.1 potassium transporter TrkG [Mycoplasmopsis cynos]
MKLLECLKKVLNKKTISKASDKWYIYLKSVSRVKYLLIVYFLIILFSSFLLWSPITQQKPPLNWNSGENYVNALFTTASAFSDTGLVVKNTYSHWNVLGQAIIAILILSGGIGIFSLKFFIINILFKKQVTTLYTLKMIQSERGHDDVNKVSSIIRSSVRFILTTSLISGFGMTIYFYFAEPSATYGINKLINGEFINPRYDLAAAFRFGFFHTISAINNAGFDIISGNSLMPYYNNITLQIWFIILLIIGGLGYPTLYDIYRYIRHKVKRKKTKYHFSLFTKVSTITYFLVFLIGFLVLIGFETTSKSVDSLWNRVYVPDQLIHNYAKWVETFNEYGIKSDDKSIEVYNQILYLSKQIKENSYIDQNLLTTNVAKKLYSIVNQEIPNVGNLAQYLKQGTMYGNQWQKIFSLIFTSFSSRSAGFATVDVSHFSRGSIMLITLMMIIGAAPASTGGGIRTTTFAILILSMFSVILNTKKVRIFKRTIEPRTVFMSGQVFVIALIILIVSTLICFSSFDSHAGKIITHGVSSIDNYNIYGTEHVWFEVASAFGTTGLSVGITKEFNIVSKITLIFVMFIGQFGISSTLLVWRSKKSNKRNYEYVTADIVIG